MAASADQPQNRHNHLYLQYVTPIPAERGLLTLASIGGGPKKKSKKYPFLFQQSAWWLRYGDRTTTHSNADSPKEYLAGKRQHLTKGAQS